ncbi:diaminopimelate epimerase [bacterium]|nr:diaminopimelate epimerase [bacterium]
MSAPVPFAKLSGAGNDHVCLDNRDGRFDAMLASPARVGRFARTLCHRGTGIGADGIIFAVACDDRLRGDVGVQFYEPDGAPAELCGNGAACFARWALDNGWADREVVRIATPAGKVRGRRADGDYIRVCIPVPRDVETDVSVAAAGTECSCDVAVTGVPHAVVYVDDIDQVDMIHQAPAIRYHERFQPRGMNVNYTQVLGEGHLAVRTYEFGVEAETLACGTGSATAAYLAALRFGWPQEYHDMSRPVLVDVRSGDTLRVYFHLDEHRCPGHVCLETVVRFICTGVLHPQLVARAMAHDPAAAEA